MAVAVDVTSTAVVTPTGITSYTGTANITVGSSLSNGALILLVQWTAASLPTGISVHWDSAGTNQLMTSIGAGTNSTSIARTELFGLINPTAGNKTVNITWSTGGASDLEIYAVSWTGVDQTGGATSFAHPTSANNQSPGAAGVVTLNITSATGNAVMAGYINDFAWASPTPCNNTQLYLSNGATNAGCANRAAGAASVSMTATNGGTADNACAFGCDIVAAATGSVTTVIDPFEQTRLLNRWSPAHSAPFIAFTALPKEDITKYEWTNLWQDPVRFKPALPPGDHPFLAFVKSAPFLGAGYGTGVLFDSNSTASITGAGVTSFTDSTKMTVGTGFNRGLIVEVCLSGAPTGVSITWNGVAMTQLVSITDGGVNSTTQLYGLRNPASGTQTLAGSWTGSASVIVSAVSFTNVEQSSDANAFQNATSATGATSPAAVTVPSAAGDMVVAAHSSTLTSFPSTNNNTLFATLIGSFAGAGNLSIGASPSVLMSANEVGNHAWTSAGIDIKPPAEIQWLIPFGNPVWTRKTAQQPFLIGTLLPIAAAVPSYSGWDVEWPRPPVRRSTAYYTPFIAQPPLPIVATAGWDDCLEWPRPPASRSMAYSAPFMGQTFGIFEDRDNPEDWTNWPDFAPGKPRVPLHQPWSFVPSPAQVFFPTAPWDDFARRRPQPLDTQPLAFVPIVVQAAQQVWYPPNTWPDFAPKARPAIDTNWLALVSPVPNATVIGDWPDFVRSKPPPLDTQPLGWTGQTIAVQQVWFPYDPWPSLIAKKPVPLNFVPATPFIQTPAQVFFPYGPWDDFSRRQRPAIDTQQLAWSSFTPAPTFFFVPGNWPDFAPKARLLVDLRPWSFIPSPAQVFFPYAPWDDFARRKPSPLIYPPTALVPIHIPPLGYLQWPDFATKKRPPLDYIPLTFVQTVRTPWNELSRWPEMVPIRSKAGLHAALQQFSIRFPGSISQATITGILNAFEVNSDIASITIVVQPSGPAVRAAVSIQEIGTI